MRLKPSPRRYTNEAQHLRSSALTVLVVGFTILVSHVQISNAANVCEQLRSSCSCKDSVVSCNKAPAGVEAIKEMRNLPGEVLAGYNCVTCGLSGIISLDIASVDVNISRNAITDITSPSTHILNLDVSTNRLSSVDFLEKFPQLHKANLSGNLISFLPTLHMPSLTVLDLGGNVIGEISPQAFANLSELTVLNLSGNRIAYMRHEWFDNHKLKNLQYLSVSQNQLLELNSLLLAPLKRLQYLDVSHNSLSHVGMLSLQSLTMLHHLDLSSNNISGMNFSRYLTSLKHLDISSNPLTSLDHFKFLPATNFTLIARNLFALKAIYANDTVGLEEMISLDLSGSSSLSMIDPKSFERLKKVKILNLSFCGLDTLDRGLFLPLVNLETINLQGNKWHCDCGLKWLLYFFLHRPNLQLEGPQSTFCATKNFNGNKVALAIGHKPSAHGLVLDFLETKTHCENATVANFTRKAHFRLGSTAMLFCEPKGIPTPVLTWRSKKYGPVDNCTSRCFKPDKHSCSGCAVSRWNCQKNFTLCGANEDCRLKAELCVNEVDKKEMDGSCCSALNVKNAVEKCFEVDAARDQVTCLEEVVEVSSAQNRSSVSERIGVCVKAKNDCLLECVENCTRNCVELAITCVVDVVAHAIRTIEDGDTCAPRICTIGSRLYISRVSRGDSGYYICRVSNVLQTQTVTIHLTLDYDFLMDVKVYSLLTGFGVAVLFIIITLIGILIEKILNQFGLSCPCDADGPIRRQNIVKILEQIEGYKKQNLERLRENYNWQVQRIKENCILQMDRVKDSYIAEQTGKIRDYGSSQIGAIKDNYVSQVQRVRDYGNSQMDWLRENYVFQRNRIHKFSKHQLIRLRENYKLQQKHLNKILENLPNIESCRKGFYSETDLTELNLVPMLVPPPPPPESVLDFPNFDEFSLPDLQAAAFDSRSGTLATPEGSLVSYRSTERPRRAYQTIEQVIRERLLPLMRENGELRPIPETEGSNKKGHRRTHSAPITTSMHDRGQATPQLSCVNSHSPEKTNSDEAEQRTDEDSLGTLRVSDPSDPTDPLASTDHNVTLPLTQTDL